MSIQRTARRTRRDTARIFDVARTRQPMTSRYIGHGTLEGQTALAGRGEALILTVPAISGGGAKAQAYAQTLYDAIASHPSACGYVVDLRGNCGGNQWPMVAGLSALLGDGPSGREIDAKGRRSAYVTVRRGAVVIADGEDAGRSIVSAQATPGLLRTAMPVAILVDNATASSAEGVAVAFHGRPATRFFGQRSYGVATSNEGFVLADGTNFVITSALMADRRWRTYPQGITPDEAVDAGTGGDPVRDSALRWLGRRHSCLRAAR